jgi:hypothetical protein
VGLKTSTIDEQHVRAVKTLHLGDDGCDSAFERRDESIIDGWIGTAMPIASVRALGSAWNSKAAEVSESQPLGYREGEVGKFDR